MLLEQLNTRIPEIRKIFERIASLNQKALSAGKDIRDLQEIWGEVREGNPDFPLYQERLRRKEVVEKEIRAEIDRIEDLGGIVKDREKGLVDFFCDDPSLMERVRGLFEFEEEGIYLCWKMGEGRVSHWHPLRGGFAARRPLEELLQARSV